MPWFDKHFISFFSPFWWVLLLCPFSILVKSLEVLSSACSKLFLKIKIPHIKINQGVLYLHPVFCIFDKVFCIYILMQTHGAARTAAMDVVGDIGGFLTAVKIFLPPVTMVLQV